MTGLIKGDTIAIIAPSSPFNRELLLEGIKRLEEEGFQVLYEERIFTRSWDDLPYFVGSPKERADEIMMYIKNPQVKAIIAARGGYGSNLVATALDYDCIQSNPKIIMGFSDLTYLLNSIYQKTGMPTFHGPMIGTYRFLPMDLDDFSAFIHFLQNPNDPIHVTLLKTDFYSPEMVKGCIVGGNLTLLCNMIGTEFDVDMRDRILFIEDINEAAYKIDRSLTHLKQAGKLDSLKAIIFGEFLACGITKTMILSILNHLDVRAPLVFNFPAGHGDRNLLFPIGGECIISPLEHKVKFLRG